LYACAIMLPMPTPNANTRSPVKSARNASASASIPRWFESSVNRHARPGSNARATPASGVGTSLFFNSRGLRL
jgi:hypothetical protein